MVFVYAERVEGVVVLQRQSLLVVEAGRVSTVMVP